MSTSFRKVLGIPQSVLKTLSFNQSSPKASTTQQNMGNTEEELIKINSNILNNEAKTDIQVEVPATPRMTLTPIQNRTQLVYSPLNHLFNGLNMISSTPTAAGSTVKLTLRKTVSLNDDIVKRNKLDSKIIYPIFYKCTKLINDEFWINILISCSMGKFKKGFAYKDGYLIYRSKDKIHIDQENPMNALNQLQYFFKAKAGIMSESDRISENMQIQQKMEDAQENTDMQWSDIKNNTFKNLLLDSYIRKVANFYELNTEELFKFKNLISISSILGDINTDNIHISNNNITHIEGLIFNPEERIFTIDFTYSKRSTKAKRVNKSAAKVSSKSKFILNKGMNDIIKFLDKRNNSKLNENELMESMLTTNMNMSSERVDTGY